MVRLSDLHPEEAEHMLQRAEQLRRRGFDHEATPWITPPRLSESKIALITTAALHRRDDPPFRFADSGYRMIPDDIDPNDLVQSHISVNFDRTHYQRDLTSCCRWTECTSSPRLARLAASRRRTTRFSARRRRSCSNRRRPRWLNGCTTKASTLPC